MEEPIKKEEPHFHVFGEDVNSRQNRKWDSEDEKHYVYHHYHHDRSGSIMGLLILFIGIVLLFNYLGIISWVFWAIVWPFWPVILILIGIRIILGRSYISNMIVFLIALAVFIYIFLYGIYNSNPYLLKGLRPGNNIFNNLNSYR